MKLNRVQWATAISIIFHAVGLAGITFFKSDVIVQFTAYNLLLSFCLLIWTQENRKFFFWLFVVLVAVTGFTAEVIGVNTGALFGNYSYGTVLGLQWNKVPLIIAINWVIVIYCPGMAVTVLLQRLAKPVAGTAAEPSPVLKAISIISDGATLAVVFDWLIEPVAIKLGYWHWHNAAIPLYNYACWFIISAVLMAAFHFFPFDKKNKFAIHLLLIQAMFFLVLRTFLLP